MEPEWMRDERRNPPVFNAPGVLLGLIGLLVGIHVLRGFLSPDAFENVLLEYALFPARYASTPEGVLYRFPGGLAADIWTPITYAFLHADWGHVLMNSIWLLAFGTPVARRMGPIRFSVFFLVCAAVAGVAFVVIHAGEIVPVVGASGAISGVIAAAILFVFEPHGPVGGVMQELQARDVRDIPRRPTLQALANGRALLFVLVWLGMNIVFGVLGLGTLGQGQTVAWEAHLAGFVAGLLLFPLMDPGAVAPARPRDTGGEG